MEYRTEWVLQVITGSMLSSIVTAFRMPAWQCSYKDEQSPRFRTEDMPGTFDGVKMCNGPNSAASAPLPSGGDGDGVDGSCFPANSRKLAVGLVV